MTRGLKLFRRDDSDGLKSSFQHFFRKGVIVTSVKILNHRQRKQSFCKWALLNVLVLLEKVEELFFFRNLCFTFKSMSLSFRRCSLTLNHGW